MAEANGTQETFENDSLYQVPTNDAEAPILQPRDESAPAAERIARLLADIGPQKSQMLAIIDFCKDQERTSAEIDEMLAPFWEHRMSIYDGIAMRAMLEGAGALLYISNDEEPDEVYAEDGSLVLPEQAVCTWLATQEGIECLSEQDPYRDLTTMLEESKVPAEGFTMVLDMCAEEGRKITDITSKLLESGIMEGAEFDPTLFVSKLEDVGALEWQGSWVATELGKRYLEQERG